jgi:hypothetical protein
VFLDPHISAPLAVLSGDTLVLRGRPGPQGQLPKERYVEAALTRSSLTRMSRLASVLYLAEIVAPRLGNAQRDDEVCQVLQACCWLIFNRFFSTTALRFRVARISKSSCRRERNRIHLSTFSANHRNGHHATRHWLSND